MLENKLSRVGGGAGNVVVAAQDMWGGGAGYVVPGLTENKTKPSSWGLAILGKKFGEIWDKANFLPFILFFFVFFCTQNCKI